jgi:outer membrane protein OmpA-like peptidoglycan-associated protein
VRVEVLGEEGERITGFAQVEGALSGRISGGVARIEADPGERTVIVRADGYQAVTAPVQVEAGGLAELRVQLVKAKARVVADRIEILDKVYFDVGKATIRAESFALLDEVAGVLIQHPRLLKVSVDGHTDDQGSAKVNTRLSQLRADAVMAYLIGKGVEAERLVAVGFGPARPLDPARTPAAREQNRRVEFVIVEQRLDAE